MAVYYNTSTIAYDSAVTPYDGVATVYTYSGNIPITLIPSYSFQDGAFFTFYYTGKLSIQILLSHSHTRSFVRRPTVAGLSFRVVPNSSMVIKQYYKTVKDPVVTGGCPQCGTYLYNQ